jgi:hypothetical protein
MTIFEDKINKVFKNAPFKKGALYGKNERVVRGWNLWYWNGKYFLLHTFELHGKRHEYIYKIDLETGKLKDKPIDECTLHILLTQIRGQKFLNEIWDD